MGKKRKSADQRRREKEASSDGAWERFRRKLVSLQTWSDAEKLASQPPSRNDPEGKYYSNFRWLYDTLRVPDRASADELILYAQFIERLNDTPPLKPGTSRHVSEKLRAAAKAKQFTP